MGNSLYAYVEFFSREEDRWKIATPMYWSYYSNKAVFNPLSYGRSDPRYALLQGEDFIDIWYSFEIGEESDETLKSYCNPVSINLEDPMSEELRRELRPLFDNEFPPNGLKTVYIGDLYKDNSEPIINLRREIVKNLSMSNIWINTDDAAVWTKYPYLIRLVYYIG